jgi:hypothetical protein
MKGGIDCDQRLGNADFPVLMHKWPRSGRSILGENNKTVSMSLKGASNTDADSVLDIQRHLLLVYLWLQFQAAASALLLEYRNESSSDF